MTLKNILLVLWLLVLAYAATVGWIGLFPYSFVMIPVVLLVVYWIATEGLLGAYKTLFAAALLPGVLGVLIMISEGANTQTLSFKVKLGSFVSENPDARLQNTLTQCSQVPVRSLAVAALHGFVAVYLENPVAGLAFSAILPDKEKVQEGCARALDDLKQNAPDLFEQLRQEWPDMPEPIKG